MMVRIYDISIVSTMGLTAEGLEALQSMKGIAQAEELIVRLLQVMLENRWTGPPQVHQNKTAQDQNA